MTCENKKTVLLYPLNSPGHINSLLGIADRLKADYGFRTVFMVVGPMIGTTIQDHGHELVEIEETTVHEDYEILDGEDTSIPVDEEEKKKLGLNKKKFPGVMKWPQLLSRWQWVFTREISESISLSIVNMDNFMVGELLENHDKYEQAIKEIDPDLIVFDSYYAPPCIVNNEKNIPWVKVHSANPLMIVDSPLDPLLKPPATTGSRLLTKDKREKLRQENPDEWLAMTNEWKRINTRLFEALKSVGGPLHKFLASKGCTPLEPGQQSHESPHLNVYLYPKELDYDQDDDLFHYKQRWFRCDSLLRKEVNSVKEKVLNEWESKLADAMVNKKEMVYFSLGSLASGNTRLMRPVLEVLAKDQERLYVISKGVNGDKLKLNSDNMIGANFLPQTFFLQKANLAIIHGGNNSVSECLYYGVPMIVLPAFADQFDNAQRVEDLGIGKRVDLYNVDDTLLDVIGEVSSNEELKNKLRQISQDISMRDDSNKVTFMLKKLADEGHLEQEFIEACRNKSFKELQV